LTHASLVGNCSVLQFEQTTVSFAPQLSQKFAGNVGLPHLGQVYTNEKPQLLQTFHPFSTGLLHFGQRCGPVGSDFPQNGHTLASGGTSSPQYSQGFLYVDILVFRRLSLFLRGWLIKTHPDMALPPSNQTPPEAPLISKISSPYKAHIRFAAYGLSGNAWAAAMVMGVFGGPSIPKENSTIFDNLGMAPDEFKRDPDRIRAVFKKDLPSDLQASLDALYQETWISWDGQDNVMRRNVTIQPTNSLSLLTINPTFDAVGKFISGTKTDMRVGLTIEKAKRQFLTADQMREESKAVGLIECIKRHCQGERYRYDFDFGYTPYENSIRSSCRYTTDQNLAFGYEMRVMENMPAMLKDSIELTDPLYGDVPKLYVYWTLKSHPAPFIEDADRVITEGKPYTLNGLKCMRSLLDLTREPSQAEYRDYCFSAEESLMAYKGEVSLNGKMSSLGYTEVLELSHDAPQSVFDFSAHSPAICAGWTAGNLNSVGTPKDVLKFIPDLEDIYARYKQHLQGIPTVNKLIPESLFP